MKKLNVFLILLTLIVFNSCKKGDDGAQGPPGTANVIYSNWLDVTFSPERDTNGDITGYSATINSPKLVDSILNKGDIKVYVNVGSPTMPSVFSLPITNDLGFALIPYFQVGKINLISDVDASTEVGTGGQKFFQYRYILIPGGAPARMPTIDWNNYQEVKRYLNLKD
jgi:hypothetical protein